jgi:hypothetical protein
MTGRLTPREQAVAIVSGVLLTPLPVIDSMPASRQFARLVVQALEDEDLMCYRHGVDQRPEDAR